MSSLPLVSSMLALGVMACSAPPADSAFTVEILAAESVEQIDSVPAPRVAVVNGRVEIAGFIGLGATGYELVPTGSVRGQEVDILLTPRMPEEMAGLTVLTRYAYRLVTPVLPTREYILRVRHAGTVDGAPRLVLEQRIRVN